MCLKIVVSEHDFYSLVFDSYVKLENELDAEKKANFFQDSICKLMEVARELNNEVFLQNAMLIISCLYHDESIDHYDSESQDMEDLNDKDKEVAKSLINKVFD